MDANISIVCKSFESPFKDVNITRSIEASGLERSLQLSKLRSIGLPKTRVLFTVLRSPHIDKKSREQFEMQVHKQLLVIKTETAKLRLHLLRLQLHDLPGVQLKVIVNYKTRLSKLWYK
uniref:ribosomal protein S10 n=1 Tax=Zygnema cf. cylindricum TaxID=3142258 RepID=UPI0031F36C5A